MRMVKLFCTLILLSVWLGASVSGLTEFFDDTDVNGYNITNASRIHASFINATTKVLTSEIGTNQGPAVSQYINFGGLIGNGILAQAQIIQLQSSHNNIVLFRGGVGEDTVIRPYTGFNVTVLGNLWVNGSLSGNLSWGNLTNFPSACPAGSAITGLGHAVTCTVLGNSTFNQSLTDTLYVPYVGASKNVDLTNVNVTNFGGLFSGENISASALNRSIVLTKITDQSSYINYSGTNNIILARITGANNSINSENNPNVGNLIFADMGGNNHTLNLGSNARASLIFYTFLSTTGIAPENSSLTYNGGGGYVQLFPVVSQTRGLNASIIGNGHFVKAAISGTNKIITVGTGESQTWIGASQGADNSSFILSGGSNMLFGGQTSARQKFNFPNNQAFFNVLVGWQNGVDNWINAASPAQYNFYAGTGNISLQNARNVLFGRGINVSGTDNFIVNTGPIWQTVSGSNKYVFLTNAVGFNTTSPIAPVNIQNWMMLNATAQPTCSGATEGGVYYNGTSKMHYGCNSTAWYALY